MVLAIGAADGCAYHMAKNWMISSPKLKYAVMFQVRLLLLLLLLLSLLLFLLLSLLLLLFL